MNKNLNILKLVAFGMLSASIVLIVLGVYMYTQREKELKEYKLIKCKIIKIDEPVRGNVELTFRDLNGSYPPFKYFVYYDASEGELEYKLNEILEVYYYEKDVSKSEIKDFINNYETPFIMLVIGFVFLIDFPIMFFVISINKKKLSRSPSQNYGIKDSVISE